MSDGRKPHRPALIVSQITEGENKGLYRVQYGKDILPDTYTLNEVMAFVSEKEDAYAETTMRS